MRRLDHSNDSRIALASLSTRLDSLDQDYTDLRSAVLGLGKRIDDLGNSINAKIDQRSQPQWQTYIAGAMLLGGLFFAFIAPIQTSQSNLRESILRENENHRQFEKEVANTLNTRNSLFVSVREHDEFRSRMDQEYRQLGDAVTRIETRTLQLLDAKKLN